MSDQHDDLDTTDEGRPITGKVAAAGITVVVLMALLAVVAVAVFRNDSDDELVGDGAPTTVPTTMVPTDPEPVEPVAADSALVGLTEAQVRELYPSVRLVEIDGEALPTTMDLQQGRINLAIADDIVVGATVEGCEELAEDAAVWLQQSCDPDPATDGPSTYGKLIAGAEDPAVLTLEVGTGGDQYHQGMAVQPDDMAMIRDTTGAPVSADALVVGDVVWVWTAECAESLPVQCQIDAIVVDRPAS